MKKLTADSFTLHFNEPGNALVRIHSNPYWTRRRRRAGLHQLDRRGLDLGDQLRHR